jgi:transposase InsO family protein
VAWWLHRKQGLAVNGKRVLRVMQERGLLVRQGRYRASSRKDWSRVDAPEPNRVWQSDMTKVWAGPSTGWSYLVSVIDCCTRQIVGCTSACVAVPAKLWLRLNKLCSTIFPTALAAWASP